MPRAQVYHQIVAQNFLRNISLDGSHDDTALRIFKERGLELNVLPPETDEVALKENHGRIEINEEWKTTEIKSANTSAGASKRDLDRDQTAASGVAVQGRGSTREKIMKGYSIDAASYRSRRIAEKLFRGRLNSIQNEDSSSARKKRRPYGRRSEDLRRDGTGLLERLKASFSRGRHDTQKAPVVPTVSLDHSGATRSVKWGALPAVGSLESVTTRASIMSLKGGEIVIVDGEFNEAGSRGQGARICFFQKHLPVALCSILPLKRPGAAAFRKLLDTSADSKSLSSTDEGGLKPIILVDEEISYSSFLIPTNSTNSMLNVSVSSDSYLAASGPSSTSSAYLEQPLGEEATTKPVESGAQTSKRKRDVSECSELTLNNRSQLQLDFRQLDNPEFGAGKHKTTLTFTSYMTSIIDYVDRDAMKREVNEKFRKRFPDVRLTYSKYQSLKRDMRSLTTPAGLDLLTLAQAYSYFDTIILKALISKSNRKHVAAVCLLLAAKMNDMKGADLKDLFNKLEDTFRLNRKDFIQYELPVALALEFSLHVPVQELLAQYQKVLWSA